MDAHEGHRERLGQRFSETGLAGFAPHEALELLLGYAIPRKDLNPLAHALMERFGSFHRVLEASAEDLARVPGVGGRTARLISLLLPLFRLYQQSRAEESPCLQSPESRKAYARALLLGRRMEQVEVIALDAKLRLLSSETVALGDEGGAPVSPRKVLSVLLRLGAFGCVLAHNHPSGSPEPSRADVAMTRALLPLLREVGIRLVDHVIVSGTGAFSFQEMGLLKE